MNRKSTYIFLLTTVVLAGFLIKQKLDTAATMKKVAAQLKTGLAVFSDTLAFPRSTAPDGKVKTVKSNDWTSGFYSGNLWYMYDYTKDKQWEAAARKWTAGLEKEKANRGTHDLGFMLYCSFGNGYRLTGDKQYRAILLEGANSLASRFNKKAGVIRSWNHGKWQFPVIVDNMMNLEFLFWASRESGDPRFRDIAITHANTTMANHFRGDFSSYHVVDYDTVTGKPMVKVTHQGFSDESAWARGQAWGLYGYVVMYRETKDKRYLELAEKIAGFMLKHPNMPKDLVPYWDFNAPAIPKEERDVSAAAITASALLELGQYAKKGNNYASTAEQILTALSSPAYMAEVGKNNHFVLMHSVGHKPAKSEIDTPLIYADYYFIEGIMRLEQLRKSGKLKI